MIRRLSCVVFSCLLLAPTANGQTPLKPRTDALGDPLPPGAFARLGTLRLKHDAGSGATISSAFFSPDGKKIATLANLGSVRVWDAATGKELAGDWKTQYNGHPYFGAHCTAMAFSPDSVTLACISHNQGFEFRGDRLAGSGFAFWDTATGSANVTNIGGFGTSVRCAFGDGGKTLVTVLEGGMVRWFGEGGVKEQRTFDLAATLQPPKGVAKDAKPQLQYYFAPGAKHLAVQLSWPQPKEAKSSEPASEPEAILFDLVANKELWRVKSDAKNANIRFAFSADGTRVAIGLGLNHVELRDTVSGNLIAKAPLNGNPAPTTYQFGEVAVSPDGGAVAICGADSRVVVWSANAHAGKVTVIPPSDDHAIGAGQCVAFSPNGKTLLITTESDLRLYDLPTLKPALPVPDGHRSRVDHMAFSADGKKLLTTSPPRQSTIPHLLTWDLVTLKPLPGGSAHKPPWPNIGLLSLDRSVFMGKDGDDRFRLFSMATGKPLARLAVPQNQAAHHRGLFSPLDKHYLLAGKDNGKSVERLYAIPSGKLLGLLPSQANVGGIISLDFNVWFDGIDVLHQPIAFSPDEKLIAVFSEVDGVISVCETATCKVLLRLGKKQEDTEGNFVGYANLAFSPDGKMLASWCGDNNIIRVWDMTTGKECLRLPHDEQRETSAGVCFAWSPDGRLLAVASRDIQVWELATLKVRRHFPRHISPIRSMAFSPDSRVLATGSADTTILLWDLANVDLETHWNVLAGDDADKAFATMRDLIALGPDAVAWIKDMVKPVAPIEQKQIDALIGQLDSDQFKVRQSATSELLKIGERVVPTIDKVLATQPTLETRQRLEGLRSKLTSVILQGERLQAYRAVEVLERIGSSEAREVLRSLADGAPGALVTMQARAALNRLKK